jgi:hypothetical protein
MTSITSEAAPRRHVVTSPDATALIPPVASALAAWDALDLEIGELAIVTGGDAGSRIAALVATWYGALPVVLVGAPDAPAPPAGVEPLVFADPDAAMADLAARIGKHPGVAAVDLSGRLEYVDLLLATIPMFARVMLAGPPRERLTIDFYSNVHRKGLILRSTTFQPDSGDRDDVASRRVARAASLLSDPSRLASAAAALSIIAPSNR